MIQTAESYYENHIEYERYDISERLKRSILSAIQAAQSDAIKESSEATEFQLHSKKEILKLLEQIK